MPSLRPGPADAMLTMMALRPGGPVVADARLTRQRSQLVKERYQQLEEQSRQEQQAAAAAQQQRPVMLPSIRSFSYESTVMPTHETEMERMTRAQSSSPPPAAKLDGEKP